ncbi:MAG: hypothetical protein HQK77_20500 [Desulfobacterales bacterium]|nr:hypothetical protein [Desulfobacterales bacterium]
MKTIGQQMSGFYQTNYFMIWNIMIMGILMIPVTLYFVQGIEAVYHQNKQVRAKIEAVHVQSWLLEKPIHFSDTPNVQMDYASVAIEDQTIDCIVVMREDGFIPWISTPQNNDLISSPLAGSDAKIPRRFSFWNELREHIKPSHDQPVGFTDQTTGKTYFLVWSNLVIHNEMWGKVCVLYSGSDMKQYVYEYIKKLFILISVGLILIICILPILSIIRFLITICIIPVLSLFSKTVCHLISELLKDYLESK